MPETGSVDRSQWREHITSLAPPEQRAVAALVGTAVGDALGAPFEFMSAGQFTAAHPDLAAVSAVALTGGGPWDPGEWTDDTQMALLVADSLLDRGGFDPADMFARFQTWARQPLKDIGITTADVLTGGKPWDRASREYPGRGGGNGSVMRAAASAIYFSRAPLAESMARARDISALTHSDPGAGSGVAIYHGIVAAALDGAGVAALDLIPGLVDANPGADKWRAYLAPEWEAPVGGPNGDAWNALGSAVWVLRRHHDFPAAMAAAIDLGHDTDTVAAIAGGLFGALHGPDSIPGAWTASLLGHVPGFRNGLTADDLAGTAVDLLQQGPR